METARRHVVHLPTQLTLATVFVFCLAVALLSINITSDYTRRHEDNNALYTTFARAHVRLGLAETKGQDLFVSRDSAGRSYYAHHPPGVGLTLAIAFKLTGSDAPVVVRSVAIVLHLAGMLLFLVMCRRFFSSWLALGATLVYALLPIGSFYGRMANHEPFALPFMILLVASYFAYLQDGRVSQLLGMVAAILVGGVMGWVTFFAVAACVSHAFLARRRGDRNANVALAVLVIASAVCFAALLLHIYWVLGGDLSDLRRIFFERVGVGKAYGPLAWASGNLQKAGKLLTISGTISAGWLLWASAKSLRSGAKPAASLSAQVATVFLLAGLAYMGVFNWGAWQHQYWQLPLLPGVAIALVLWLQQLAAWSRASSSRWALVVVLLVLIEIPTTAAVTLIKLQTTDDRFALKQVNALRRAHI